MVDDGAGVAGGRAQVAYGEIRAGNRPTGRIDQLAAQQHVDAGGSLDFAGVDQRQGAQEADHRKPVGNDVPGAGVFQRARSDAPSAEVDPIGDAIVDQARIGHVRSQGDDRRPVRTDHSADIVDEGPLEQGDQAVDRAEVGDGSRPSDLGAAIDGCPPGVDDAAAARQRDPGGAAGDSAVVGERGGAVRRHAVQARGRDQAAVDDGPVGAGVVGHAIAARRLDVGLGPEGDRVDRGTQLVGGVLDRIDCPGLGYPGMSRRRRKDGESKQSQAQAERRHALRPAHHAAVKHMIIPPRPSA